MFTSVMSVNCVRVILVTSRVMISPQAGTSCLSAPPGIRIFFFMIFEKNSGESFLWFRTGVFRFSSASYIQYYAVIASPDIFKAGPHILGPNIQP